jgi:hypothetical protein
VNRPPKNSPERHSFGDESWGGARETGFSEEESMKCGYARVSTDDQSPAPQLTGLKRTRCRTIFKNEGPSGATIKRPALARRLKPL